MGKRLLNIIGTLLILLLFYQCKSETDQIEKKYDLPNIIIILVDDMGYSDIGAFGGEIPTPNIDALALSGFKMTQFYNAGRCCPTRASLLTGLYQHQAGVGFMDNQVKNAMGVEIPAYQGYLNQNCVTIAEVLKNKGYQTFLSGKWHIGKDKEHWPSKRGFDQSYTFLYGAGSYFNTKPYRPSNRPSVITFNDTLVEPGKDFYLTSEISRHAVEFLKNAESKSNPFFLYVAYTAPHWPLHALEKDIALFRGNYKGGWDSLRTVRYQKMINTGIIKEKWKLSQKYTMPENIAFEDKTTGKQVSLTPQWETLTEEEKDLWDLRMAVYSAMIYRMDIGIGQIVDQLKTTNAYNNTLIMFMSDNGACHEPVHTWDITYDRSGEIGSPNSFDGYSYPWANASNTPFRLFKHWTAEGGISTPFIASWPKEIRPGTENTTDYAHIIDVMATCVDVAKAEYPMESGFQKILPMEGNSMLSMFKNGNMDAGRPIFWEHQGNLAVRQGDWKLVKLADGYVKNKQQFQLFNLNDDRSESRDLIELYPGIADSLNGLYDQWAIKVGVDETIEW